MSSLAFLLMVLHISAYSIRCLSSPFPAISRRFVIRARVGDDILDFSGFLVALGHQCFPFPLYVQIDVVHNHYVVISHVDLVNLDV